MDDQLVFTDLAPLTAAPNLSYPNYHNLGISPLLTSIPSSLPSSIPDSSSLSLMNSMNSFSTPSSSSESPLNDQPNGSTTPMEDTSSPTSSTRLCRICSDKSDGAHFGVDSCRACAAFFRRSIVMKKKYVCRQGGHNCNINKSVRCMCRKCRFVKCLQCGMLPESVQTKEAGPVSTKKPTPSASSLPVHNAPIQQQQPQQPQMEMQAQPSSSGSPSIPAPLPMYSTGVTKLNQIDTQYKMLCSLRRSTEMSMSANDMRGIFESSCSDMRPTTFSNLNKLVKSTIPMLADFCGSCFPQFSDLGQDEKWSVFQNFMGAMWNTESIYRTHKIFPNDISKKVCSFTTYIDLDNLDMFLSDTTTKMDVKHFGNLIRKNIVDAVRRIIRMLARIEVTDLEFAALLGLLMWPPYLPKASERVVEMALGIRELIFRELHVYYSSILRMEDYAGRLGELMSLYSSLQWSTNRMKEDMEIFKLFDIFEEDSFFYDIIKK
ncbi:hypothetical protein PFISCL1PPCAC_23930 [Pristionchus fissidentatus]|uniref:Nuclear receptor n=1 Tax=Pristionchus fissidentatus TaxID=1538716 RepID=A0AAV5WPV2_9BILA|nr:hypothetical protein PFISCL1PPCAC_23930 [Pristionchus fissidentatus]